ncbi:LytR/AlgR family response regulator transcription factor [Aquiflexum lacus]|uniref:LytR/AlgR family response regulator transcription factor n=1 Tax=Aquiflexum lacus TaxID=2483805 RepID=UPI001893FB03|nr:LytTR family DNA-binding domain-containing protein [Aquiflexum lacus]
MIIEDEGAARRRLEGIVKNHSRLNLMGSASSGAQAIELIKNTETDLLLMDIQLKDMTAFEVLNKIEKEYSGNIIFITAYNNFAVKAFEVFAIDYVLKPYSEERLLHAIDRCLKTRKSSNKEMYAILESLHFPNKICIPEGKTSHLFEKNQIEWIKADGYHCEIHTIQGKSHLVRILLKDVHQLLPDNYIRISRSVILNMNYVTLYRENSSETVFVLKNGMEYFGKTGYNK